MYTSPRPPRLRASAPPIQGASGEGSGAPRSLVGLIALLHRFAVFGAPPSEFS